MNANRLFPGMCDGSQEFFYHEDEQEVMLISKGSIRKFSELPPAETVVLDSIIDSDQKLKKMLNKWFPKDREAQKQELAKCRFGGLNHFADVSACKTQNSPDFRTCKLYGACEGEGIVCKPLQYNDTEISRKEIAAMDLLGSDCRNKDIAEKLNLPLGTFNVFKSNLYEKMNIHNKQQLTRVAVKLGIS